jgi:hypothetical protein
MTNTKTIWLYPFPRYLWPRTKRLILKVVLKVYCSDGIKILRNSYVHITSNCHFLYRNVFFYSYWGFSVFLSLILTWSISVRHSKVERCFLSRTADSVANVYYLAASFELQYRSSSDPVQEHVSVQKLSTAEVTDLPPYMKNTLKIYVQLIKA